MRLVGASNWTIRLPFVLEGVVAALAGSILSCVSLGVLVKVFITDWLAKSVTWIPYINQTTVWMPGCCARMGVRVLTIANERVWMLHGTKKSSVITSALLSIACAASLAVAPLMPVQVAHADTYSDLINAQNSQQASAQRESELRSQLAGVSSDLADTIVQLDDLTNNKIPAAQQKVSQANAAAAAAKSEADDAAERLKAAQKDKSDLEANR